MNNRNHQRGHRARQEVDSSESRPKRKKRKFDDLAYHPSSSRAKRRKESPTDMKRLRTSSITSVIQHDGEHIPLKTTILINATAIAGLSQQQVEESLALTMTPHRPIASLMRNESISPGGTVTVKSPIEVVTPGGAVLKRRTRIGLFDIFSNESDPDLRQVKRAVNFQADTQQQVVSENSHAFHKSTTYQTIKKVIAGIVTKDQKITLTKALLDKTKKEYKDNHYRRSKSQNQVMTESGVTKKNASAHDYVSSTNLFTLFEANNTKCEWLHLIAHEFLGSVSQDYKNLAAGSEHANTEMMFAEAQAKRLALLYAQGVTITVKAELYDNKHIAKRIFYTISAPDFEVDFTFYADSVIKPHIVTDKYAKSIIDACLAASAKKSDAKSVTLASDLALDDSHMQDVREKDIPASPFKYKR